MKGIFDRAAAIVFAFAAGHCCAQSVDEAASAPEPAMSMVWVFVFLGIFVGICAWIAIGIWRNERKNRASREQNARS